MRLAVTSRPRDCDPSPVHQRSDRNNVAISLVLREITLPLLAILCSPASHSSPSTGHSIYIWVFSLSLFLSSRALYRQENFHGYDILRMRRTNRVPVCSTYLSSLVSLSFVSHVALSAVPVRDPSVFLSLFLLHCSVHWSAGRLQL